MNKIDIFNYFILSIIKKLKEEKNDFTSLTLDRYYFIKELFFFIISKNNNNTNYYLDNDIFRLRALPKGPVEQEIYDYIKSYGGLEFEDRINYIQKSFSIQEINDFIENIEITDNIDNRKTRKEDINNGVNTLFNKGFLELTPDELIEESHKYNCWQDAYGKASGYAGNMENALILNERLK